MKITKPESEFSEVFPVKTHSNPQFHTIEWRPKLKSRSQPQMLMNFRSKFNFGLIKLQSIRGIIATHFKTL